MVIETIDRGNGLTELRVKEKKILLKKKKKKVIAWSYLAFICWMLIFGAIFVTPTVRAAFLYEAYWIVTIGLAILWLIANYIYKDFGSWLRKKLSKTR